MIFDFDGVLGDTWDIRNKYLSEKEGISIEEVAREGIEYFSFPHTKKGNLTEAQHKETLLFLQETGEAFLKMGYELFDEFIEEIRKIQNAKLAIVSTASSILLGDKIKQTGLPFTHVLTFEYHHSKEEKIQKVSKDWGIQLNQIYYFTDTKADVLELENFLDKTKIIGCSWGYHNFDILCTVLPQNQILKNFQDIHRMIN